MFHSLSFFTQTDPQKKFGLLETVNYWVLQLKKCLNNIKKNYKIKLYKIKLEVKLYHVHEQLKKNLVTHFHIFIQYFLYILLKQSFVKIQKLLN